MNTTPVRVMRVYDIRGFMACRADLFTKDRGWCYCFTCPPDKSFDECLDEHIDKIRQELGKKVKDMNDLVIPEAPNCEHRYISLEESNGRR